MMLPSGTRMRRCWLHFIIFAVRFGENVLCFSVRGAYTGVKTPDFERSVKTVMQDFLYKQFEDESYSVVGYEGDEADVVIPDTYQGQPVTILGDSLFKNHTELRTVKIPDTVTDLGGFLFDGCVNLRHVDLPAGLLNMWQYAFARCGIEEIDIPEKVRSIAPYTFKDCASLRKVTCGAGVKKIYGWAFQGCEQLTELYYEPGTEISPKAFSAE